MPPPLVFAQGCPADELMSLPRMVLGAFGKLGPQMLCSQTSLEHQLRIVAPPSLGLGEEGHDLLFCGSYGSAGSVAGEDLQGIDLAPVIPGIATSEMTAEMTWKRQL